MHTFRIKDYILYLICCKLEPIRDSSSTDNGNKFDRISNSNSIKCFLLPDTSELGNKKQTKNNSIFLARLKTNDLDNLACKDNLVNAFQYI